MKKPVLNVKTMIRPQCAGFEPYKAGRPVETIKRELGLKKVIKLASNENPLGPSKKAISAAQKTLKQLYFYPDSNSFALKQALAKHYRLPAESIVVGAGSDEIIELLAKLFFTPDDEVVISEHAFIRYQMAADLMGSTVRAVPMRGYTHDLPAMAAAVTAKTKAIFIANPNNPTGTYNSAAELDSFMAAVAVRCGATLPLVIMDEAYYEFACQEPGYPDTQAMMQRWPNLVILRTFSKVYALAGLRVGYGFAHPSVVDYIDRIRPPFNLNIPAQAAAVASLADAAQVIRGYALVRTGRNYLYKELARLDIPYIETAANFVLMNLKPFSGQAVFQQLLRCGVIVRAMDEYAYPTHIRVTIGLPAENRLFIRSLTQVLAACRAKGKKS